MFCFNMKVIPYTIINKIRFDGYYPDNNQEKHQFACFLKVICNRVGNRKKSLPDMTLKILILTH